MTNTTPVPPGRLHRRHRPPTTLTKFDTIEADAILTRHAGSNAGYAGQGRQASVCKWYQAVAHSSSAWRWCYSSSTAPRCGSSRRPPWVVRSVEVVPRIIQQSTEVVLYGKWYFRRLNKNCVCVAGADNLGLPKFSGYFACWSPSFCFNNVDLFLNIQLYNMAV